MSKGKAECQSSSEVFFGHADEMQKYTFQSEVKDFVGINRDIPIYLQ